MTTASTPSPTSRCHHCGQRAEQGVTSHDHHFCCGGCAQVYEFLKNKNLDAYYQLDPRAGSTAEAVEEQEFELLKDPVFNERYVVYRDAQRVKISWSLPHIHCRACVWLLEKLPQLQDGVQEARVDLMRKKIDLVIEHQDHLVYQTSQTLIKMGYSPDLRCLPGQEEDHRQHHRDEWLKIGVAGFCFGNVMLFSFPEYFGVGEISPAYQTLFRVLNFILSCPVLLYCSRGILLSGVKSLSRGGLGMDLPIAIGIVALFSWSSYDVFLGTGSGYFDSLCGLIFFLLVGRSFQRQSFQNLVFERDEHRFFPLAVSRIENGREKNIPLSELKTGDHYRLAHGAMIPTDSQLLSGEASLDYRLVSGESELQRYAIGERIYAGGLQRAGRLELLALQKVSESSLAKMWSHDDAPSVGIESLLDQIGRIFTFVIMALALVTFIMWKDSGLGHAIELSCAVLIVACPCALALSAPLTLGAALRHFSKAGCYLKSAQVIENFSKIDTFVFDKTGTLTCVDQSQGMWLGNSREAQREMARACATNSNHPVAVSIVHSGPPTNLPCTDFTETPGCGMSAIIDGHRVKIGKPAWALENSPPSYLQEEKNLKLFTSSKTVLVIDGLLVDSFAERLRWRTGVEDILPQLSKRVEMHLLSGDDNKDLQRCLKYFKPDHIHFQQSPQQKRDYIQQLQQSGKRVAMVGDGINDALAMKVADVGIAIPVGSGRFAPSSDVILAEAEFIHMESFLTTAKSCLKIVVVCVLVSLAYNILGLTAAMEGWISPLLSAILMPLSSFSVMTISLLLTRLVTQQKLNKKAS